MHVCVAVWARAHAMCVCVVILYTAAVSYTHLDVYKRQHIVRFHQSVFVKLGLQIHTLLPYIAIIIIIIF